jgi:pyrimidine-nucleoside phosphorylase
MSSLLMAICINGMSFDEVINLTDLFINSGDTLNYEEKFGTMCDKHSTGGIGDKTTLVVVPIVASLGIPVIKMSGRGLGYTGGTIDKLESIPGFRTDLSEDEILESINKCGACITGQTKDIAPMDKVIYTLRDVSGTTSSIPLIAVSIMSKKIALGASKILLDVKYGSGALVSTIDEAKELGELMKKIGSKYNREVRYILSDMNEPLGMSVGNSLEVMEAIVVLSNKIDSKFKDLCILLSSNMISMVKGISLEDAKKLAINSLESGKAYNKFLEIVKNQGGDINKLDASKNIFEYKALKTGTISKIDALGVGKLSLSLGAGRVNKEDNIDYSVGVILNKLSGMEVKKGDTLMSIYYNNSNFKIDDNIIEIK